MVDWSIKGSTPQQLQGSEVSSSTDSANHRWFCTLVPTSQSEWRANKSWESKPTQSPTLPPWGRPKTASTVWWWGWWWWWWWWCVDLDFWWLKTSSKKMYPQLQLHSSLVWFAETPKVELCQTHLGNCKGWSPAPKGFPSFTPINNHNMNTWLVYSYHTKQRNSNFPNILVRCCCWACLRQPLSKVRSLWVVFGGRCLFQGRLGRSNHPTIQGHRIIDEKVQYWL